MMPPEGSENRSGTENPRESIEGSIRRERELRDQDPVRRDSFNFLLRRKKEEHPDLPIPDNFGSLLEDLQERLARLPQNQRRGIEKIFYGLGQRDLPPEEQERLVDELLSMHNLLGLLPRGVERPAAYPTVEMPPPGTPPITLDDLNRILLEKFRGGGREIQCGPDEEPIEFIQPPYPPTEIPVKKDKEALMDWMRQILNNAERSERESYGAEINAGELQRIAMVMRALREKSRKIQGEHPEEAIKYMDKAESMREEYEARLYFHEYFVQYRKPEDADRMFDQMSQMLRSRYFKIIFSKPEVRAAFLLHKQKAVEYFRARGENRTKPEDVGKVPQTSEDVRFDIRIKMAEKLLPDEWAGKLFNKQKYEDLTGEQKAQVDSKVQEELTRFKGGNHGEEELFQRFGWAQNLAERMWRITGMAAIQDRLDCRTFKKNGQVDKTGSFMGSTNNGDLLMQRALNVMNNFFGSEKAFRFWPKLLQGVDLGNKDFFTFILGAIVGSERNKIKKEMGKENRSDLSKEEIEIIEQELKKRFKEKFDYDLIRKKDDKKVEIIGEQYRPLNATDKEIVAFDSSEGQKIHEMADAMSDKTMEAIFSYDWDSLSDTAFRGWQWLNLINVDKLRGSQYAGGRDKEAFLINPSAETLAKFVAAMAYRATDQPDIRTKLVENLWTYMAHERKQHTGLGNANWDELETTLAKAIEAGVVSYAQAKDARKKAVNNDLLVAYKAFEKYFNIWEFLLGLVFDIAKEGIKPIPA